MDEPKHRIIWSPEAVADLDGIWDYYEQIAGAVTAEDIVRRIYHACAVLQDHALAGHSRDELKSSLRSISVQPFIVYYIAHVTGASEIIRVLDARQDTDSAFSND